MDYKIRVYIPSTEKYEYIKEFKNKQTLDVSKYIKSNDDYGLSLFFDNLLEDVNVKNIADKFFILCQLRALNLSNSIVLNGKHISGGNATFKVNIFTFLQTYLNFLQSLQQEYIFEKEKLKIHFNLPKNLYFKNFYSLLYDIVTKIEISGEDILKNKTHTEKFEIITKFNTETLSSFKNYLNELNNASDLYFIKSTEEILVPTIKISFFNNTIFSILKSIYKTEITYFYNKFYICLTKLGLSLDDYLKLSFVETDILLNIYKSANKLK